MADVFKYILMGGYVALTYYLSLLGMRKAKTLAGFSIGNKDMGPVLIGITMAASIASSATFLINPGFVYTHGLSAWLHYGIAAWFGIAVALTLVCRGFRGTGESYKALTIPHWIYCRYGSRALSLFFAVINLLSITFVVLIMVGSAILCAGLFGISQKLALALILIFVFSYVLMGGAYAHAYTNAFQGVLMTLIALFIFFSGLKYFDGGFLTNLKTVSPEFAMAFNPESTLYYDFFSVVASGFLITFALMMQPHILTKTLYLQKEKDVSRFLATTLIVGFIFSLMLFVGFFAQLKGLDIAAQDKVTAAYLAAEFGGTVGGKMVLAFISVALLAAGMSTLDGILVALSSMVVNDLYLPFAGPEKAEKGLVLSRYVLVAVGIFAFAIAWNPPALVGLFAQKGVYGLAAASVAPITLGVLIKRPIPAWIMGLTASVGLFGHLGLNLFVKGFENPSVSSSYALIASFLVAGCLLAAQTATTGAEDVIAGEIVD